MTKRCQTVWKVFSSSAEMFIRHRDLLSEPPSRKTYALAKGMQVAERLC